LNEESLKYEVLLEKIKTAAEENPEEIANLLENLVGDESIAQNPLSSNKREL
jgi:flagellar M-ring protein FliF